ncbi:DNA polymerase III subunit delta' [Cytobacillus purgationiresistens]|uniref:DNA polymerase III subunit delta' n=1 Tax=Cytobacillus purgationiresistens TaxID=863449 RepID=A0ABU0APA2_9BACI|nr:DNA polymerase III subunit delta' [Cytobacillus purgationiresistens]MDQ0273121.1 DNA polymerase-3 subunit delta' [Cytobacillus purgationiresistens]
MTQTWEQFQDMQPVVLKMFKNSLSKNRLAHAYLFEGMKGTGKKGASLLLAKSIFCLSPIDGYVSCETCLNCKRINHNNHPDVHMIEPDGQSIKKQQIRALQEEFSKTGVESNKKVYVIVHADRMTVNAANSLLKFLEEPHAETTAILITEQSQRMLPTILSRCQSITFKPLSVEIFIEQLKVNGVNEEMAAILARITHNLDEALAYSGDDWFVQAQKIVLKLYEVLKKNPLQAMVTLQEEWFPHFKEKDQLDLGLDILLLLLKDLLYIQLGKGEQMAFVMERNRLEPYSLQSSSRKLTDQITAVLESKRKLQANMNPQLLMEQLVLKMQEGSSFV